MNYVEIFFAGVLLCNCIPHLASGLRGEPFPTPFAKPHGVGLSPPVVNFVWGFVNLLLGSWLYAQFPVPPSLHLGFLLFLAGFLVMGLYLSWHFGKVLKRH